MVIFHLYLKVVEPTYAYLFTALHIYSIIYMIGDYNWVRNTPIRINGNNIEIKIGARREIRFHISDIELVREAQMRFKENGGIVHEKQVFHATSFPRVLTRLFGITDELMHEVIFNRSIFYTGYFGIKKKTKKVSIYIKDSEKLATTLKEKMKDLELSKYEYRLDTQLNMS